MSKDMVLQDIPILLERPWQARFSMRSMLRIETRYGSLRDGLGAIAQNDRIDKDALAFVISTMVRLSKQQVLQRMEENRLPEIMGNVLDVILAHLSDPGRNQIQRSEIKARSNVDWDFFIFTARHRLGMTEEEFWRCTPRKFYKFFDLYLESIGQKIETKEERAKQLARLDAAGL